MIQYLYALQNDNHSKYNYHLSPYIVKKICFLFLQCGFYNLLFKQLSNMPYSIINYSTMHILFRVLFCTCRYLKESCCEIFDPWIYSISVTSDLVRNAKSHPISNTLNHTLNHNFLLYKIRTLTLSPLNCPENFLKCKAPVPL